MSPERRRSLLLDAALQVFALYGIQRAKHAHVAEKAKVSLSTVFVYFPSHEDLVTAVLSEVAQAYLHLIEDARRLPGKAALACFLKSVASFGETKPAHARILFSWSRAAQEPHWDLFVQLHQGIVALLARTIECGRRDGSIDKQVHPERTAETLLGRANMLLQLSLTGNTPIAKCSDLMDPAQSLVR